MNWDRIEGNWKQLKGQVREQWAKLTDDHIEAVAGKRDLLVGKIQEMYGITKEETEKQVSAWEKHQNEIEHTK
jgi:uncharacterized protein YjbJ (UPF0337 family)